VSLGGAWHKTPKIAAAGPLFEIEKTPKICINVHKTLNTKVVDLNTTYNFHKGYMGFFSMDFAQKVCQH
jgi:hypothetical protein